MSAKNRSKNNERMQTRILRKKRRELRRFLSNSRKVRAYFRLHSLDHIKIKETLNGTFGYLYVFRSGESNLYKIGFSGDWQKRLNTLRASDPTLSCEIARRIKDVKKVEKELHTIFKKKQYSREYFDLSNDDLKYIEKYLEPYQP